MSLLGERICRSRRGVPARHSGVDRQLAHDRRSFDQRAHSRRSAARWWRRYGTRWRVVRGRVGVLIVGVRPASASRSSGEPSSETHPDDRFERGYAGTYHQHRGEPECRRVVIRQRGAARRGRWAGTRNAWAGHVVRLPSARLGSCVLRVPDVRVEVLAECHFSAPFVLVAGRPGHRGAPHDQVSCFVEGRESKEPDTGWVR